MGPDKSACYVPVSPSPLCLILGKKWQQKLEEQLGVDYCLWAGDLSATVW